MYLVLEEHETCEAKWRHRIKIPTDQEAISNFQAVCLICREVFCCGRAELTESFVQLPRFNKPNHSLDTSVTAAAFGFQMNVVKSEL